MPSAEIGEVIAGDGSSFTVDHAEPVMPMSSSDTSTASQWSPQPCSAREWARSDSARQPACLQRGRRWRESAALGRQQQAPLPRAFGSRGRRVIRERVAAPRYGVIGATGARDDGQGAAG